MYGVILKVYMSRLILLRHAKSDWAAGCFSDFNRLVSFRGRRDLPVVAFEGAIGTAMPAPTGRTRVVVFYSITGGIRAGHFGILTQGFPQLVRVNEEVLKLDATDGWPEDAPVLCRVKMINEFPLIPNLELLEGMIAAELI